MIKDENNCSIYINSKNYSAFGEFSKVFQQLLIEGLTKDYNSIVILCIGTDRSTGDSLGPLTGYKLHGLDSGNIYVYGSLDKPVHAKNLEQVDARIKAECENPFVVAIDACLGSMEHVGYITLGRGPLRPGAGVSKNLQPIGNMHITGIVNFGGFMDFIILQNTRLATVMRMADIISTGIRYVVFKTGLKEKISNNTMFMN